jgi:hypothetical protein
MMEDNVNITVIDDSKNNLQNITEYQPTEKEKMILEVLLNPDNRTKSISDICKAAGCSRPVYYEAFDKPGFKAIYETKSKELVKHAIGPVINAFIKEAVRGSYPHGKTLLEMAGMHTEGLQVNVTFEQLLKKALESGE